VNGSQRAEISIRSAEPADAARVAAIFNQGVDDRVATFETHAATPEDAERWIADDVVIVAESGGTVIG
jgi:L-amino acid N-acyltransferase YncA